MVPHSGSGLLLGLIVRASGRLVEARPCLRATEDRSACSARRLGGPNPGHPRSVVAPLPQREGLLAFRPLSPALLLPEALFAEPVQPAGTCPGARIARSAACLRPRTRRAFGRLPRRGHHPRPCDGAGEGFSQGALLRASELREERFQDRVGLRLQGGSGGRPRGGGKRLRAGASVLGRKAHRGRPHSLRLLRCLPGRQRLHGGRVGAALDGRLRGAGGGHPEKRLPPVMVEGGSALG
jgi:hypothetical protein